MDIQEKRRYLRLNKSALGRNKKEYKLKNLNLIHQKLKNNLQLHLAWQEKSFTKIKIVLVPKEIV